MGVPKGLRPSVWKNVIFFIFKFMQPLVVRTLVVAGIAVAAVILYQKDIIRYTSDATGFSIVGVIVSFMVLGRSSQAYARYFEGRGALDGVAATLQLQAAIIRSWIPDTPQLLPCKEELARYMKLLFRTLTIFLRQHSDATGLYRIAVTDFKYSTEEEEDKLRRSANPHLLVLGWFYSYYVGMQTSGKLGPEKDLFMSSNQMYQSMQNCARIAQTPYPGPYAVMGRFVLDIYVFALPFALCTKIGWWTIPIATLAAICFFGLWDVSVLLENPLGLDVCDFLADETWEDKVNTLIDEALLAHIRVQTVS